MKSVLFLNLRQPFFDQIAAGEKLIEYREQKPHWASRIESKSFEIVRFRNGYLPTSPEMDVEFRGVRKVRKWGGLWYAISLGSVLKIKRKTPASVKKIRRAGTRRTTKNEMNVTAEVLVLAQAAHRKGWQAGKDVGTQTKRSNTVCRAWQDAVKARFPDRFHPEHRLNKTGRSQQIDLVDTRDRVAYELKSSPNNVHMEIYRDVFKALVFNRRNPELAVKKLVFIAPQVGIDKLGKDFPQDVIAIAQQLSLELILKGI